ncbi:MAG TPA: ABC-type transport auxiliary lipoprotein family protein [Thermomonas sp.]|nr:ABC-type transport auxiliary lipoprotein family protein [Thermomonas sp.]
MTHPHRIALAVLLATLAGCSSVLGPKDTPTVYAPQIATTADPAWPTVTWPLGTVRPTSARILDGTRIAVSPAPGELQVYKSALWARTPPEMLEEAVLRTLEDSGKIPAVARQGSGIGAEYRLVMDIRHFEADYAGGDTPSAVIEVNAKLLHIPDQSVVGSRTFRQVQPATGTEVGRVAEAFGQALGTVSGEVAGWTLATGNEHQRQAHR